MSSSVWFEEVNTGLIEEIKKSVMIVSESGEKVPIQNVMVRKPEEDFKIEKYPCVSIYNRTYKHDPMRYSPDAVKISIDRGTKTVEMEDTAVPFNLRYQIDFWSEYQVDIDSMTASWLIKHFRQFNLSVIDSGGNKRTCNCMTKGDVIRSDLVKGDKRIFHAITNLEIWVELDEETRYNKPMVTNIIIDTTNATRKENDLYGDID